MKSLRLFDRRAGYSLASLGLLLGMVVPSLIPAFASAGTITTRSIAMSTATHDATAEYTVTFTPTATFDDIVIDWCSDTPLIGVSCAAPAGLKVNTATLGTTTNLAGTPALTTADETANHTVLAASPTTATSPVSFILSGVTNPSAVGTFYARIYTYTSANYANTNTPSSLGTTVDTGSVALSTTNQIGVTAYVLESMLFCVSGQVPYNNCGEGLTAPATGAVTSPSFTLGETSGNVIALDSTKLSTHEIYTQLSTNAASGAVVNLKSDATSCGGLYRNGSVANCEIGPETTSGGDNLVAGVAKFGLTVGNFSDATNATNPSGTLEIPSTASYDGSHYFINYVSGNATGVTSTYGDPILDTNSAPVNNKNAGITFAASIDNTTPAGVYGADLSLIATGKF